MNSAPILSVHGLRKEYGSRTAVEALTFSVAPREIVGLLGPNGAGKTTTISMILGVLEPTSGTLEISGFDIVRQRSRALELTNFAAVYAPLPGNLTVEQNLRVFGMIYRTGTISGMRQLTRRIHEVMEQFDLLRFRNTKCGVLSSGEQTRVSLAKAMLNRPRLLLLDEPTASLDPATAQEIRQQIRNFAASDNIGVLWTSHNMREVEQVCHRVLFLSHGQVLLEGDPKHLPAEYGKSSLEELFISVAREPLSLEVER